MVARGIRAQPSHHSKVSGSNSKQDRFKLQILVRKYLGLSSAFIALLFALCACSGVAPPTPFSLAERQLSTTHLVPAGSLVIEHGTVVDGTGRAPIQDGIVVIRGNRIETVGHAPDFTVPPEIRVIDAAGGTILPGIINSHVHEITSPLVRQFFFLTHGVTSACDLATPLKSMSTFQDNQRYGLTARGFRAGPIINVPRGYPGTEDLLYPVNTPEEARAAVDDIVDHGADLLKIAFDSGNSKLPWHSDMGTTIPNLDLKQAQAIVQQAHARGKLVRVHIGSVDMLDLALDAGVDVIEHVPLPRLDEIDFQSSSQDPVFARLSPAYESKLGRIVSQNVVLVPTLDEIITWCEPFATTPERKRLCGKYAMSPVHRFIEMGGTVALGDDSTYGLRTMMPLREMERLLAVGLSALEVIQAGTQAAAKICGHGDELGTLELGKLADVIVVKGNPLADIHALSQLTTVIIDGQVALPK